MSKAKVSVVLIDDNPVILDVLRRGVDIYAEIASFTDSTTALAHCLKSPPDLIICDYRMPEMDGAQLVQALKSTVDTSSVPFILLASKPDIEEHLKPYAEMVEEFVSKPFYVKELAQRAKKILDRAALDKMQRQASKEGVIGGRLSEMNLIDLFQSLEQGQKNCSLTLARDNESRQESCRMYFQDGQLNHAELGAITGDEAVYAAAGWQDATFEIDFNSKSEMKTTTKTTQGLLMEALRLVDEANR
ncbi:MAG: response regulator [Acidobacteria bacterium]|nr:response regulator [Acidobacteriota bacterium]